MSKSYSLKIAHKNYKDKNFVTAKLDSERPVKSIIQKAIFTALEKTKEDEIPDYGGVTTTTLGLSKDLVAVVEDGVFKIVSNAKEFSTLMRFLSNEISCPLTYTGTNDKAANVFKKLAKTLKKDEKDSFKFEELNAATKAKIRKLSISINCIKATEENTVGEEFLRQNPDTTLIPFLNATYAGKNAVCNQYIETAKCLAGKKKPSYYATAPKKVKESYDAVYEGLKKLKNNSNATYKLQMLLLCTDLGKYTGKDIKEVAAAAFDAHTRMESCNTLYNTLQNMAAVTKTIDSNLLGYPNLWIATVKAFGEYGAESNEGKKNKKAGHSDRWLEANKKDFSDNIRACLTKRKKTIKNTNIVLATSPTDEGIVFTPRTLSTISFVSPYTNTISVVLKALRKELEEV